MQVDLYNGCNMVFLLCVVENFVVIIAVVFWHN